ncbi:MAG: GNAT family N-acetyltransferase [Thermomicrobiales bacterium]|nr:GNAT family N-acetyltransferase [Thermomicrobiales bacterium]
MDQVTIRAFRPQDQATVRALVLSGLGDHFGTIDETMNPDLDDIESAYVANGACVVVAEFDGGIVGAGTLVEESPGVGRLVRMSVARDQRGRGIGRKLVNHLLDEARTRGYGRVLVETTDDWQDAIGLYRACGFQTEGFRDGDVHMYLDLT